LIHRAEMLAALVADLKQRGPDHITITGDLVNLSLSQRVRVGARLARRLGDPRERHQSCPAITIPMCARPRLSRNATGSDFMRGDGGESFPFVRRRGPLALIGLSTSLPTAAARRHRTLHGDQLDRLGELLAKLKREQQFRVVLIHHPPFDGANHFPPADECRRAARRAA
jgi:3',5'-cyclic AMP phosphodiesterase CpdA